MEKDFKLTPKRKEYLDKLGLYSCKDIVSYLPYRYEDLSLTSLDLEMNEKVVVVKGVVVAKSSFARIRGNLTRFSFKVMCGEEEYNCIVFNRSFYYANLKIGNEVLVKGKFQYFKKEIVVQDLILNFDDDNTIKPLYSLPQEVKNKEFSKIVQKAYIYLDNKNYFEEIIPDIFREKYHLISRRMAYYNAHFPSSTEDVRQALRYLKYEELLVFTLAMQLLKNENTVSEVKAAKNIPLDKVYNWLNSLKFKPTIDQQDSINEILKDLRSEKVMYRLLQGDVGTGKTLVAVTSLVAVALASYQGVLMAPTDILARQHYASLKDLAPKELNVALLVGSMSAKEKEKIYLDLINHKIDIVVGTHALIQDSVNFANLGLIVIDEQHRFGVQQRRKLKEKGEFVELLSMSATPIPRTLAISLYGDMDVSTLQCFPSGKRDVETKVLQTHSIISLIPEIKKTILNNKKVYIVCSMIDGDNETRRNATDVYNGLKEYVKDFASVGLLHGKMNDDEKIQVMNDFSSGVYQILISTTVVEVGVDVKSATMMIIYDSENFGLAQIHQLRGRIGRDGSKAKCYLLTTKTEEETLRRLKYLEGCNDGFEIARFDLSLRGPGQILGVKQSGLPTMVFASLVDDIRILDIAQKDAQFIMRRLNSIEFSKIIRESNEYLNKKMAQAD